MRLDWCGDTGVRAYQGPGTRWLAVCRRDYPSRVELKRNVNFLLRGDQERTHLHRAPVISFHCRFLPV